jgi:ketosteroid isomerase-like protein
MSEYTQDEIYTLEDRLTSASRSVDLAALDALYADDILMTNVLGQRCNKAALMDEATRGRAARDSSAAAGKPITSSYDKEDLQVMINGDTAVTTYRFVVKMIGENLNVNRQYRTTNVWMKRQGRWQVGVAHTAFLLSPTQAARLAGESD